MARKYELRQRAEAQAETRQRIVDATVALHGSVGPAATTISAIAERAGVQRLTVYRHFPDERALFEACSGHWAAVHPMPDPSSWSAVDDPETRLELALGELYAHYRETERMTTNVRRDLPSVPAIQDIFASRAPYWRSIRTVLVRGWNVRGRRRRRLEAVIGHAADFETWRSLTGREGVGDDEAVEMMVALARAVTSRPTTMKRCSGVPRAQLLAPPVPVLDVPDGSAGPRVHAHAEQV